MTTAQRVSRGFHRIVGTIILIGGALLVACLAPRFFNLSESALKERHDKKISEEKKAAAYRPGRPGGRYRSPMFSQTLLIPCIFRILATTADWSYKSICANSRMAMARAP